MVDFSAAYNPLIAQNQAPANPLAQYGQVVGIQRQQNALDSEELSNAKDHMDYVLSYMGAPLAKGPNVTMKDVIDGVSQAVANSKGRVSPEEGQHFLSTIPANASGPDLYKFLQGHQLMLMNGQQRLETMRGQPVQYDSGGNLILGSRSNMDNSFTPQATIQKGMTPEGASTPTDLGTTRSGQSIIGTRAQFVQKSQGGQGAPATPDASGQPAAPQGGGVVVGLPAGAKDAMDTSGKEYAFDQKNAADYRARVTPLETAIPLLEKLGPGYQGQVGQFKADIQRTYQAVTGSAPPDDPVKAYDELQKYLIGEARSTGASGTNDQLAAAIAGNPSTKISNAGATDVAKAALALKRLKQAQIVSAQSEGVQPGDYLTRSSTWNSRQDPRAYAFDLMTADAQKKLITSLGKPDSPAYQKFISSLQTAHNAGVLTPQQPQQDQGQ